MPINVPDNLTVSVDGRTVRVKGPLGELEREVHPLIEVRLDGKVITVHPRELSRNARALHGLFRSLIENMVVGVSEGYSKELEIRGVGYKAEQSGDGVKLSLGFSHPVNYTPPDGVRTEVNSPTTLTVKGTDKELVMQVAAVIRALRPPEPYKGKGIRYKGERIRRKATKTVGVTG